MSVLKLKKVDNIKKLKNVKNVTGIKKRKNTFFTSKLLTLTPFAIPDDDTEVLVGEVYSRFPDGYFPRMVFFPERRFPERRFPDGHFPGKMFPGWSFSRMRQFLMINLQAHT